MTAKYQNDISYKRPWESQAYLVLEAKERRASRSLLRRDGIKTSSWSEVGLEISADLSHRRQGSIETFVVAVWRHGVPQINMVCVVSIPRSIHFTHRPVSHSYGGHMRLQRVSSGCAFSLASGDVGSFLCQLLRHSSTHEPQFLQQCSRGTGASSFFEALHSVALAEHEPGSPALGGRLGCG